MPQPHRKKLDDKVAKTIKEIISNKTILNWRGNENKRVTKLEFLEYIPVEKNRSTRRGKHALVNSLKLNLHVFKGSRKADLDVHIQAFE